MATNSATSVVENIKIANAQEKKLHAKLPRDRNKLIVLLLNEGDKLHDKPNANMVPDKETLISLKISSDREELIVLLLYDRTDL